MDELLATAAAACPTCEQAEHTLRSRIERQCATQALTWTELCRRVNYVLAQQGQQPVSRAAFGRAFAPDWEGNTDTVNIHLIYVVAAVLGVLPGELFTDSPPPLGQRTGGLTVRSRRTSRPVKHAADGLQACL